MQRRMTIDNKIHVLNIKYNKNIEDKITYKDNDLYYKNINLNPYNEEYIKILGIYEKKNSIVITGLILKVLSNDSFTCNDRPIKLTDYEFNVFNYFKKYSPNYKEFDIVLDKCNKIVFKLNNRIIDIKYAKELTKNYSLIHYNVIANQKEILLKKNNYILSIKKKILLLIFNKIPFKINKDLKLNKISKLHLLYTKKVICNYPSVKTIEELSKYQKNMFFKNTYKVFKTNNKEIKELINKKIYNFIITK